MVKHSRAFEPVIREEWARTFRDDQSLDRQTMLVGLVAATYASSLDDSDFEVSADELARATRCKPAQVERAFAQFVAGRRLRRLTRSEKSTHEPVRWRMCSPVDRYVRSGEMKVYVIGESADGPVKIGISVSPAKRLASVQTGNPRKLYVLAEFDGEFDDESWLHAQFGDRRMQGEWFDFTGSDGVAAVQRALAGRAAA